MTNDPVCSNNPDYIVPFHATRDQAYKAVCSELKKNKLVTDEQDILTPDSVKGVFMPFVLYGVDYQDRQLIQEDHKRRRYRYELAYFYHYREAEGRFSNVLASASGQLEDPFARQLEPYDLTEKQPFQTHLITEGYAVSPDRGKRETEESAIATCKELFDDFLMRSTKSGPCTLLKNKPAVKILSSEYVLLPVWTASVVNNGICHTVMVNGQTGKGACLFPRGPQPVGLIAAICSAVSQRRKRRRNLSLSFHVDITNSKNTFDESVYLIMLE